MFDPEAVKTYKLFYGDARDVLRSFKPGSVHSIFATPAAYTGLEYDVENTALHELFYRVLHKSGSLFTNVGNVDMEGMGWIHQHDFHFNHYTKSDSFYREFNDLPLKNIEDYAKARKRGVHVDGMSQTHDVMCNFYTPPGGITMDPTMGDGPYLIAALQRGRRAIGIERHRGRYDLAVRRLQLYSAGVTVERAGQE